MHPRHNQGITRRLADAQEQAAGNNVHRVANPARSTAEAVVPTLSNGTLIITRDGDSVVEFTTKTAAARTAA